MKYHKVTVTLKNGFTYSYTCIGRMLEGMKSSSQSYWTEKIEVVEITEEDFRKTREVTFTREPTTREDKVLRKAIVKSGKVVDTGKLVPKTGEKPVRPKKLPKFSSLENFFDGEQK